MMCIITGAIILNLIKKTDESAHKAAENELNCYKAKLWKGKKKQKKIYIYKVKPEANLRWLRPGVPWFEL